MLVVLGSIGFFSAIGVKSTLIIMEVIFFLVLAIFGMVVLVDSDLRMWMLWLSCGSEKVRNELLKNKLGFDDEFNYKEESDRSLPSKVDDDLKQGVPGAIPIPPDDALRKKRLLLHRC
ncbi:hypothetical protein Syun_016719 [Stephania yunnanensis]|uniref:Transmembrane protein n=1 Tax=Stephania yunnanensis TaxID=152371 RepID=A0AAP0J7Y5_9MAGN